RDRCHDTDARSVVPVVPEAVARLADRRPGRNPHHRARGPPAAQPTGTAGGRPVTAVRQIFLKPWIWSFIAAFAVWLLTIVFSGGGATFGLTQAALTFAAFSIIVGLGQMFVITLGPGNVDLSIPATMTLAGTVALKVMDTNNDLVLIGLALALLVGVAIGVLNFGLINILRLPPILATLSTGFVIQSAAIWCDRRLR